MDTLQQVAGALARHKVPFLANEPLKNHTSFRIGGPAALFCSPENEAQLAAAIALARSHNFAHTLLGRGSNVLFPDEGYPGLVIHIGAGLAGISVKGHSITAGAGAQLAEVCLAAGREGMAGLEFAYGIPGSVGGAVFMNAGAYDGEIAGVLSRVRYLDESGSVALAEKADLQLGYRTSLFQHRAWVILEAVFLLHPEPREQVMALMQRYRNQRATKQPLELPSAGSTFKRPAGAYAGALIDQSGLRGYRIGDAAISEKHCGFIVNLGNATCADVLALAEYAAEVVRQKTGYVLEKEIRLVEAK